MKVRKAALEFFSMLIAVGLAMVLTEWRQNQLNRKEAKESYQNILLEIEENYGDLVNDSTNIGKDLRYIADFIKAHDNGKKHGEFTMSFQLSFLNTSALEVAKINQSMAYLPNERNIRISEVYQTQAFYEEKAKEVFNVMAQLSGYDVNTDPRAFIAKLREYRFQLSLVKGAIHSYLEESEAFIKELEALNSAQ